PSCQKTRYAPPRTALADPTWAHRARGAWSPRSEEPVVRPRPPAAGVLRRRGKVSPTGAGAPSRRRDPAPAPVVSLRSPGWRCCLTYGLRLPPGNSGASRARSRSAAGGSPHVGAQARAGERASTAGRSVLPAAGRGPAVSDGSLRPVSE